MNNSRSLVILTTILYIGLFIVSVLVLVAPENLAMERVKQLKPLKEGYYRVTPRSFYNEKTEHLKEHLEWYVGSYDLFCNRKDICYQYIMEVWQNGECIDSQSVGVSGLLDTVNTNITFSIHKDGSLIIVDSNGASSSQVITPYDFDSLKGNYIWAKQTLQETMREVRIGEEIPLWFAVYNNSSTYHTSEIFDYTNSDNAFVLKMKMSYEEER